jgi:hypothetical protein
MGRAAGRTWHKIAPESPCPLALIAKFPSLENMSPNDVEPDPEPEEGVDRNEWLAQEVDASWAHLTSGDLCCGPTASWCDVYVRKEDDGSYSLRFFGEGLEPSDPPEELDSENYASAQETVAALASHGFVIDPDDLPDSDDKSSEEESKADQA